MTEAFQLSVYQAKSILKTYPSAYIEETLSIVKAKRAEGSIKNLPAFTLSIIKNDYAKSNQRGDQTQSKREQNLALGEPRQNGLVNSQIRYDASVFSRDGSNKVFSLEGQTFKGVDEIFEGYSPKKREKIIKAFEADKITNDFMKTLYDKYGLNSVLFKGMLQKYIE